MEIHFAAWLYDRTLGESLTKKGANNRLLSYYFIDDGGVTKKQLKEYVRTGKLDNRKRK